MDKITKIAEDCVRESTDDYVGLWQIATRVRREIGTLTNEQVINYSLDVVRHVITQNLYPGDYLATGFRFWDEHDSESIIARIEKEWRVENGDPTLAHSICWFAAK